MLFPVIMVLLHDETSLMQYLRLMLIWTLTTAFNGVYQPLVWLLENVSGSPMEQSLVWMLLVLSVAGMAGNVSVSNTPWCLQQERGQFLEILAYADMNNPLI